MGPIMTTVIEAYNLIKDPQRWTQGYYQRDKKGNHCPWREGHSFCALGSISFISGINERDSGHHGAVCILQRHSEKMFKKSIQDVNDFPSRYQYQKESMAHQNVLRVFESVIDRFSDRDPTEEEYTEGILPTSYLKNP